MGISEQGFPSELAWQITTTTIWCPLAEGRVTLIVRGDWTSYCCWYQEQRDKGPNTKARRCQGDNCSYVLEYRDRLGKEELEHRKKGDV